MFFRHRSGLEYLGPFISPPMGKCPLPSFLADLNHPHLLHVPADLSCLLKIFHVFSYFFSKLVHSRVNNSGALLSCNWLQMRDKIAFFWFLCLEAAQKVISPPLTQIRPEDCLLPPFMLTCSHKDLQHPCSLIYFVLGLPIQSKPSILILRMENLCTEGPPLNLWVSLLDFVCVTHSSKKWAHFWNLGIHESPGIVCLPSVPSHIHAGIQSSAR